MIFNYAQEVFSEAGYGVSDIMFSIVITGIVNLVFTFVAIHTVDRIGRRIRPGPPSYGHLPDVERSSAGSREFRLQGSRG